MEKSKRNLFSVMGTNSWTVVYDLHGNGVFDSEDENGDGVLDRVTVSFEDDAGEDALSFVDTDANGSWDHKIDTVEDAKSSSLYLVMACVAFGKKGNMT